VFPLNVRVVPRLSRPPRPEPRPWPRVSIVVPARNEERAVEAAVRSLLAQDYPDFELIVVDDRSGDATGEILDRLAAGDARLRVVRGVDPPDGWLGKPHALHQGTAAAAGDLLHFADADMQYGSSTLREAVSLLEAERLDLVAFFPRFEMEGFWENVLMPYLPVSFFLGPAFLFNWDAQRLLAAGAGAGMLVRRHVYDAVGGHAALRGSVIDDVHLATEVRRAGLRCRMVNAEDRAAVRMYRGFREVFDGFTKNVAYTFTGPLALPMLALTIFVLGASVAPPFVLLGAAFGAPLARADVGLAAAALGTAVIARAALALYLRYPLWTALTQPLMAVVWSAIAVRSLVWRFLRRELVWRGRRYDASRAGF
jgi:chlorobactene glucosyltransferase